MFFCFQENIFEWQFAIRGPRDSEFEGGIYHGRIQLPAEYPFKPPSFMLLSVKFRYLIVFCHIICIAPFGFIFYAVVGKLG